ncbi:UDP-2,4-diacetamido-2,4,6-trideoxy-beta-L-altropyranose hydrolase [Clostridium sp.]|uniref:UDP-2,4-diacetamido-2,4, 6-trideoxy-beta-L-altropyranose hydrolase n=1 Tax=Clostridium sp. TaxID=1506 RepID=UPI003217E771
MKKILIRADGGKGIGMGHIMRMLVLAKELRNECEVSFICKYDDYKYLPGIRKVQECGFKVHEITSNNVVKDIIQNQQKIQADLLITDSYDVDEEYFDILNSYFTKTVYVDDINICRINTDIIINQNINAKEYSYNTKPNKGTKLLLGSKYIMLREEFRNNVTKKIPNMVKDIILTLGGMDDNYLTLKVLESLIDFDGNVHVILGGAFEEELIKKVENFKNEKLNVITHKNAIMSEVMKKCDLAISACGSTLYELSAMKVPTIGIVVADNQKRIAEVMDSKKIIINTEELILNNIEIFKCIVNTMIDNQEKRKEMMEIGRKEINTYGVECLAREILNMLN